MYIGFIPCHVPVRNGQDHCIAPEVSAFLLSTPSPPVRILVVRRDCAFRSFIFSAKTTFAVENQEQATIAHNFIDLFVHAADRFVFWLSVEIVHFRRICLQVI